MSPVVFTLLGGVLMALSLILGRLSHPVYGALIGLILGFLAYLGTIVLGLILYSTP